MKYYILENEDNDIVGYYINLIKQGILVQSSSNTVLIVKRLADIKNPDAIVVLNFYFCILSYIKFRNTPIITWFQGIMPEERTYLRNKSKFFNIKDMLFPILEKYALRISSLNIFVSDRMRKHYIKKYNYKTKNDIVIPCYNQHINESVFYPEKYLTPSFVYAGSVHRWQCIDEMLILFRTIKEQLPSATLTIYTKEQKIIADKLKKHFLENIVTIRYVPYQELEEELKQFKYGFLLREDHIVNNVATPIKINTYMANGIIPILTDVIDFYNSALAAIEHKIILSNNFKDVIAHCRQIINFEHNVVNTDKIRAEYVAFFNKYYNDYIYVDVIKNSIKRLKV